MDSLLMLAAGGCCRSTHWLLIDATPRKHGALQLASQPIVHHSHWRMPRVLATGTRCSSQSPRRDALSDRALGADLVQVVAIIIVPVRLGSRDCSEERRWLYTYRKSTDCMLSACNLSVVFARCSLRDKVLD